MTTKPRPEGANTLSIAATLVLWGVAAVMLLIALSVALDPDATAFDGRGLWAVVLGVGVLVWFAYSRAAR